jgi:hypothetical protein
MFNNFTAEDEAEIDPANCYKFVVKLSHFKIRGP